MKIAIVGGTHGNEPVGVEAMKFFKQKRPSECLQDYQCFLGNPEAYKLKQRFVDSDLNRAFGKNGRPQGYEKNRKEELEREIKGSFDLVLDLHTTTTNMGLTAILNNTNRLTQYTCAYLKSRHPELRLIEEDILDEESTHLNRLAPAGITIEVGPVSNNVISADLVLKTQDLILSILNWSFEGDYSYTNTSHYKVTDTLHYPKEAGWFIHPDRENRDFEVLKPGDPVFINSFGDVKFYSGKRSVYPFFINEAAYQNDSVAMVLSDLKGVQ